MKKILRVKIGDCQYKYLYHSLNKDPFKLNVKQDLRNLIPLREMEDDRIHLFYFLNMSVSYDLQDSQTNTGNSIRVYKTLIRFLQEHLNPQNFDCFMYYCDPERESLYSTLFRNYFPDTFSGFTHYVFEVPGGDLLNLFLRDNFDILLGDGDD